MSAIRFRKYTGPQGQIVTAVRLNEKNSADVVAYINKNAGTAIDESRTFYNERLKDGQYTAVKIALVQKNVGSNGKVSKGVRKAFGGDLIVRTEVELPSGKKGYEFSRIRDEGVDGYSLV